MKAEGSKALQLREIKRKPKRSQVRTPPASLDNLKTWTKAGFSITNQLAPNLYIVCAVGHTPGSVGVIASTGRAAFRKGVPEFLALVL